MTLKERQHLAPPVIERARTEPARLVAGNPNLWEDIRLVLLDPDPVPRQLEFVRRWLRDQIEQETLSRLRDGCSANVVRMACRMAPRLLWTLPYSRGIPPEKYHRRIMAVLLPDKLRRLEEELAVHAFHDGLRRVPANRNHPF
ncbi:hypothetical protein [Luteolibacter marinus]|uniref:hypothetical protein n=1 Tax=Luteolibacter marinus TaxID=2776705 RepID=UPI001868B120|nr:hypothetical protein [Luteolibacter marinus]